MTDPMSSKNPYDLSWYYNREEFHKTETTPITSKTNQNAFPQKPMSHSLTANTQTGFSNPPQAQQRGKHRVLTYSITQQDTTDDCSAS